LPTFQAVDGQPRAMLECQPGDILEYRPGTETDDSTMKLRA
jgi:hypothetical protein